MVKKWKNKNLNQFLFFQVHKQAYHINLMKDGMKVKIKHVKRLVNLKTIYVMSNYTTLYSYTG